MRVRLKRSYTGSASVQGMPYGLISLPAGTLGVMTETNSDGTYEVKVLITLDAVPRQDLEVPGRDDPS